MRLDSDDLEDTEENLIMPDQEPNYLITKIAHEEFKQALPPPPDYTEFVSPPTRSPEKIMPHVDPTPEFTLPKDSPEKAPEVLEIDQS